MIKIGMVGMNEGNGHPYSWGAIINGKYDEEKMKNCPYPVIYQYLSSQPKENLGLPEAKVTHIWTENPEDGKKVAETCFIENIASSAEELIGKVDAIIITTDIGSTHLKLASPFIKRDIPVFIDKPLTDNEEDLKEFVRFFKEEKLILSSSSLRYAKEIEELDRESLGEIIFVNVMVNKTWERYGIHGIEGLYQITGPGVKHVQNFGTENINIVHLKYSDGRMALINTIYSSQIFGRYDIIGSKKSQTLLITDTFYMFKKQLKAFIKFVKERKYPYSPQETIETCEVLIAGIKSREGKGKVVDIEKL